MKTQKGMLTLRADLGTARSDFAQKLSRLQEQQPRLLQNFTRDQSDARREALNDLEQLAFQLRTYLTTQRRLDDHSYGFPDGFVEAQRLPAVVPRGFRANVDESEWSGNDGFRAYAFEKTQAQRCSYSVRPTSDGREAAVIAECDEDGDGIPATYAMRVWFEDRPDGRIISRSPFATELIPHE